MKVGLYFDLRNPPLQRRPWAEHYGQALERIDEAERLGANSVWLSEHHFFEDGYLPQPLTFAAAVAGRTRRVRIGTAILIVPLRDPVHLAEEAAIVDLVSGGRLDLGIGTGYRVPEFAAFGTDLKRRYALTEERILEVLRLWASGAVTPPPVQSPIPIWGGFSGPRGARLAGRHGWGLLSPGALASEAALLAPYREGLEEGGHGQDAARIRGAAWVMLADDPEAAWSRIKPHFAYMWDSYNRYSVEGTGMAPPPAINPDAWVRPGRDGEPPRFQVLTAAAAAEFIQERMRGLPVEELFFWASIAGMPDDLVERHIQLVSTELRTLLDEAPESQRRSCG